METRSRDSFASRPFESLARLAFHFFVRSLNAYNSRHSTSVYKGGRVIPASKFSANARGKVGGGPTIPQLQKAVKEHLAAHPEINTTVPQQLLSDAGYELLYTPPYVSELQPIEMIWAFTKHLVARRSHRTRSVHEAAVQTREAMDRVDAERCRGVISHVHKWIHEFMMSDAGGSLRRFLDLPMLMYASPALLSADDLTVTPPPSIEDEEDDEE